MLFNTLCYNSNVKNLVANLMIFGLFTYYFPVPSFGLDRTEPVPRLAIEAVVKMFERLPLDEQVKILSRLEVK